MKNAYASTPGYATRLRLNNATRTADATTVHPKQHTARYVSKTMRRTVAAGKRVVASEQPTVAVATFGTLEHPTLRHRAESSEHDIAATYFPVD